MAHCVIKECPACEGAGCVACETYGEVIVEYNSFEDAKAAYDEKNDGMMWEKSEYGNAQAAAE